MANVIIQLIFFGAVIFLGWILTKDKPKEILDLITKVQETVVHETEQLSKFNTMSSQEKKDYQLTRAKQILKSLGKENVISDEVLSAQIEQAVLAMNVFFPKDK